MTQSRTILVVLIVALASIAIGPSMALPTASSTQTAVTDQTQPQTANSTNATLPPGSLLSGVIGVQEAEINGSIERGEFGIKVAQANTANAQAAVVGEKLNETKKRLQKLQQRLESLNESLENGSISNGTYSAQVASINAQLGNLQRIGEEMGNVSARLPTDVLRANNINVTAINELRLRASTLGGPRVASIAQTIAGPDAGKRPPQAGTPGPGSATPTPRGGQSGGTQTSTPAGGQGGSSTGGQSSGTDDGGGSSSGSGTGAGGSGSAGSGGR